VGGIIIKSEQDLELMRPACSLAGTVLNEVAGFIRPGVSTRQVDVYAAERIKCYGAKSAFLGYRKFPCHTCLSVNEAVVHGLASDRILQMGDIVSVDVGVLYNGFIGDTAKTVAVGGCSVLAQELMDVTEKSLYEGIAAAVSGNYVSDISCAVQTYVEAHGFSVVREFVGHGVGRSMHEKPDIPNYVDPAYNQRQKLRAGMTLAIEPMVNAGRPEIKILKDNWTVVALDGSLSAHFEHTVLVTEGKPEILTWAGTKPSK
jgi:methionyl aminopeptidase